MNKQCIGCREQLRKVGRLHACDTCMYYAEQVKIPLATNLFAREHEMNFCEVGTVVWPLPVYSGFAALNGNTTCQRVIIGKAIVNVKFIIAEQERMIRQFFGRPGHPEEAARIVYDLLDKFEHMAEGTILLRNGLSLVVEPTPYA